MVSVETCKAREAQARADERAKIFTWLRNNAESIKPVGDDDSICLTDFDEGSKHALLHAATSLERYQHTEARHD